MQSLSIRKAFTLLEVMIVLALFGLVAGLVIYNIEGLVRSYSEKTLEATFFEALRSARFEAIAQQAAMELRYDPEAASFLVENENQALVAAYSVNKASGPVGVEFFPRLPSLSLDEALRPKAGAFPLKMLLCTPQGYSPPVQVVLSEAGHTQSIWLDPFSAGTLSLK